MRNYELHSSRRGHRYRGSAVSTKAGAIVLSSALLVVLAACGSSKSPSATANSAGPSGSAKAPAQVVTFAEVGPDAAKLPIYAAISEGYYAKEGLTVKITNSNNSSTGAQQIIAHGVDLAEVGVTDGIAAVSQGGDLIIVAGEQNKSPYAINAKSSIKSLKDLEGKKASPGSAQTNIATLYFNQILQANKVDPNSMTYVYAGSTADRFAALVSGVVSASLLVPPYNFEAEAKGYPTLALAADYSNYPFTAIAADPSWAKDNSKALISFIKGEIWGIQWVNDPKNKDAALKLLQANAKASSASAEQTYDFYVNKVKPFAANGEVPDLGPLIDLELKVGGIKNKVTQDQVVDNQYAKAAYSAVQAG